MNIPDKESLAKALDQVAYTLDKAYLSRLKRDYSVWDFDKYADSQGGISYEKNIRILKIGRWVKDAQEQVMDCFKNVLGVFSSTGGNNIALIIKRTPAKTEMYFAVRSTGNDCGFSGISRNLMRSALKGNFNGTSCDEVKWKSIEDEVFHSFSVKSVATVCGVPSEKSKEFVSQGIEKLLEGIIPSVNDDSYTLVILAEPLSADATRVVLNGYEEIATTLTPFATEQVQFLKTDGESTGKVEAKTVSDTISEAITKTHSVNVNVGANIRLSGVVGLSGSVGYGYSNGRTNGIAKTDSLTNGTNYAISTGSSEGTTYSYKAYPIANLISRAEKSIKRIQNGQANGLWSYATYVLSPTTVTSKNVAGYISAVLQGDESYIEQPRVNEWSISGGTALNEEDRLSNANFSQILKYIKKFSHPIFVNVKDKINVNATSCVTTSELSAVFAFPRCSVPGLPVITCAKFGREPHSLGLLSQDIDIGCAYHMHTAEERRIHIDKNQLTKHTFITGSTGSGKSNTIYQLLEKLCPKDSQDTSFLVIEPAKGEYKDVFGGRNDVSVYGTNPYKVPTLLQINPFSFPDDIHVLEHIDRLVEVFNACWPMYAAMPAILKEAVERIYEDCGWNLKLSRNPGRYPTFTELLQALPKVVDSSNYSGDTGSDYKGALVTRIRALTYGIHGQIFGGDIPCHKLFDKNAIVDISRIGSSETKALIMGILILKLQEHRMSNSTEQNQSLRHITVLEEAHNLLRRTSAEQSQESSNLQGKSVEMIANSIAEMRTYGEGFIIADQSPGLMDMSVIRNTNTKVIMRLPDEGDRQLVGKAAGLKDTQIEEIARLKQGVAVVSQSDWLEPVLCLVDEHKRKLPLQRDFTPAIDAVSKDDALVRKFIRDTLLDIEQKKLTKDTVDKIRKWYANLHLSPTARDIFEQVLAGHKADDKQKLLMVYFLVGNKMKHLTDCNDVSLEFKHTLCGQYGVENVDTVLQRLSELYIQRLSIGVLLDKTSMESIK